MKNTLLYALVATLAATQGFSASAKQPMRYMECNQVPQHLAPKGMVRQNGFKNRMCKNVRFAAHRHHQSTITYENWSGYLAMPHVNRLTDNVISEVRGSWIVPAVTPNPTASPAYSAQWVGIDGGVAGSDTVEQIGTEADTNTIAGITNYYAWYETYSDSPDLEAASVTLSDFPVNPGDRMYAKVQYIGKKRFLLKLVNLTQHVWTRIIAFNQFTIQGRRCTAEWIVEAPRLPDGSVATLANFGNVSFTHCQTKIKGHNGPINDKRWHHAVINMSTTTDASVLRARTSSLSQKGRHFSVDFVQSGVVLP